MESSLLNNSEPDSSMKRARHKSPDDDNVIACHSRHNLEFQLLSRHFALRKGGKHAQCDNFSFHNHWYCTFEIFFLAISVFTLVPVLIIRMFSIINKFFQFFEITPRERVVECESDQFAIDADYQIVVCSVYHLFATRLYIREQGIQVQKSKN